jgi:hypothetical protein
LDVEIDPLGTFNVVGGINLLELIPTPAPELLLEASSVCLPTFGLHQPKSS